ncbi:helix-turn-helix domain-containing protein [Colwellia sp. 12G3]|uniref:helix-turn-helix domain-containing protein n=1 Tax=Colwellia sp. 12G3 TaxID=2058299 RepID=UPI000C334189|nr:helix-turn-helix domain-containing protein [Colwellia sp. 12G3]PKI17057.1 AraC family transcriptional regulator [Colwellia sp. 12G3]
MSTVLFNTLDLALLFTIYQCVLFAFFLLLIKKGKKQSNVLLALFLLSYAAIPLDTLINFGEEFRQFAIAFSPNIFYVFGLAYWLEAVLLLFYVRSLIYKDFSFKRIDLLYLLPFVLYLFYETSNWYMIDSATKIAILNGYHIEAEPFYTRFINLFRECFRAFCGVLCLLELRHYQKQIKDNFADIEEVDLTWLKILVIGFLIIKVQAVLVTIGYMTSIDLNFYINYPVIGQVSNFMVMFLISFLIFFSLGVSNIFHGIDSSTVTNQEKQSIDPAQISALTLYMQEHKPYLNHLLTLDNLATQTFMPSRQLSQVINRHFEKNFFEFINSYRIEESKILLAKEENAKVTMLEIMAQAGFNSKATFNTFFKKSAGMTPTQFRKEQREK